MKMCNLKGEPMDCPMTSRILATKMRVDHSEVVACIDNLIPRLIAMLDPDNPRQCNEQIKYAPGLSVRAALDIEKRKDKDGVYYAALSMTMAHLVVASFVNTIGGLDVIIQFLWVYNVDALREETWEERQLNIAKNLGYVTLNETFVPDDTTTATQESRKTVLTEWLNGFQKGENKDA